MDYTKINITLTPFDEVMADILTAELSEIGCEAFDECPNGFNAYITQDQFDQSAVDAVIADYATDELKIDHRIEPIQSENWNAVWEANFEPVIIDYRCTIRAPFHQNLPPTEYTILIAPKMAFGTGHHETTYLASEALLNLDLQGRKVLDMGCGTGILAILAAMKGATEVLAIDNDPQATENAVENIGINKVDAAIKVVTGNASLLTDQHFDIIVANINRNILLNDMHAYAKCLVGGGILLLSGFYAEDCSLLEEEAASLGLTKKQETVRNRWAMLAFTKD